MMARVRYLILQEEKLNQDQEARDDDHLEDLEADDKQEEIHLPDRKVRIKIDICYVSGKKYDKPKINKISSREALKILQSSMIWHQFPSLTNQTQM